MTIPGEVINLMQRRTRSPMRDVPRLKKPRSEDMRAVAGVCG